MSEKAKPRDTASPADGIVAETQSLATSVVHTAKDKAADLLEEQKASAADQAEDVARVLDEVSQHVPVAGSYLRDAASGIHRVSSDLRGRSVGEMLDDFGRFAARRPAALIGASIVGGFALARFLKSSADRRRSREQPRHSNRAETRMPVRPSGRTASNATFPDPDGPSEAALADVASPVGGMGSASGHGPGTGSPSVRTSSAGGSAEAPDQGAL
jgi:hypothetical protein